MKKNYLLLMLSFLCLATVFGQEKFPPEEVITGTFLGKTMPLRDFPTIQPGENRGESVEVMVPNDSRTPMEHVETSTLINNLQTEKGKIVTRDIEQNFIGASASESGFFPPDATGAVGPNHYVHSVNSLVKIFDKSGNIEVGPVSLSAFLGINSNAGDPIVMYDQLADRWVVSEFGSLNNSLAIGVSETNDPTGAYNVYQYVFSGFPDYPKYGLWHDGYYGTVNLNGQTTQGFVMERDEMLAGGPDPQILIFNLPQIVVNPNQVKSPGAVSLLGTDIDTSTPGYITYLQDDGWTGSIPFDHLKVWEIDVDWSNTGNSTISQPLEIPTDPFDAGELFGNGNGAIRQPGTSQRLAGHGGIISFPTHYRSFGSYNSWLITFNTFIDNNETGGIRWIELRNDGSSDWSIFQEGTYSIADGHSRLMSSAAMDAAGNIGMAYTTASENLPVSLRYTGRFNGDPLGEMTVEETTIIDGPGVRNNSNRYGDYSHMSLDPNDFTFWFTSDYFSSTNQWRTQIASYGLSGGFATDIGATSINEPEDGVLTTTESVEVTIRNFGSDPQSGFPLELYLDGSLVATEVFSGTINSNEIGTYTFNETLDLSTQSQTYTIEVATDLSGDEFENNDRVSKDVTNIFAADVGALAITSPETGNGLGMQTVTIEIQNYGANSQSNFDVQYSVDGGTPVVETFTGTIETGETTSFDFAEQINFTELKEYEITASTNLSGDEQASNDSVTIIIENLICQPDLFCALGDGFELVSIAEINNVSGCEGYGDFRSQIANLAQGSTNDITLTTGFGSQNVKVWIDFNDDFVFSGNEVVVPNFEIAPGETGGTYTETLDLIIPSDAALGEHIMRVRSNRNSAVPNGCIDDGLGEVEDYTVNIGDLGVNDFKISDSELIVTTLGNNKYDVALTTTFEGGVYLSIFNTLGQEIAMNKTVSKEGNTYKASLDMSNVSSGVYILRMGGQTTTSYKTARIIVE
ncbi:GEVED domain-containing protein [uncultured Marixanthomonas sp.]|uniref:GEVED domain-containing protein n=1 Tax=uncultured Marixanthomonas sp. TaxID=757245 RepID=UPI0030D8560D|tara:strand:- start:11700 stop:14618 length:2919 start_codon:yes stop_codon:yes gene_type:complete